LSYNMRLSLDFHKLHLGKLNISYINLHKTVLNKMKRTEYYYFDKLLKPLHILRSNLSSTPQSPQSPLSRQSPLSPRSP
jgi:hypothetical protein